jgi:hypothetical protein
MKRIPHSAVLFDGHGRLYRQGRLMAVLSTLVFGVIFAGIPCSLRYAGAPSPLWMLLAAGAAFMLYLFVQNLVATFRRTNWLVWISRDGLYINCRSYQDRSLGDPSCVVHIPYAEVAQVREHICQYTTPSSEGGSTHHRLRSLDIQLREPDASELAQALTESRQQAQPERVFLGVKVRSQPTHFPISQPQPGLIRIAWRGGVGNWIAPSLKNALRELANYVPVAAATHTKHPNWSSLTGDELDAQLRDVLRAGGKIDAIKILVRRSGCSLTEAKQFIEGQVGLDGLGGT